MLPHVIDAIGHVVPLIVDGGIRRGTDVLKVLAGYDAGSLHLYVILQASTVRCRWAGSPPAATLTEHSTDEGVSCCPSAHTLLSGRAGMAQQGRGALWLAAGLSHDWASCGRNRN